MNLSKVAATTQKKWAGFSLVELMVAMVLGLILTFAMATVYLSTKTGMRRQTQLGDLQRGVRLAFDYVTQDARMAGHLGCFTGRGTGFVNRLNTNNLKVNFAVGIEGYDYANGSSGAYALTSIHPANSTTASDWTINTSSSGTKTIPLAEIDSDGLTPGSDVLVIRTVASGPVRLATTVAPAASSIVVADAQSGTCSGGDVKQSGFCPNSYGLLASCKDAQVFTVASITGSSLALSDSFSAEYLAASSEVFPMQTVVYYVKGSSSGLTTSLYRRTFDGDHASGLEQELVEGVENMQLRYGADMTSPPDGGIDGDYTTADGVGDWGTVVSVRMSLLLRATDPADRDAALPTSALVNGVTVSFPSGIPTFDRRVFTTTVALRNRIAY